MSLRTILAVTLSSASIALACVAGLVVMTLAGQPLRGALTLDSLQFLWILFLFGWGFSVIPTALVAFATGWLVRREHRAALAVLVASVAVTGALGLPLVFQFSFGPSHLWKQEALLGAVAGVLGTAVYWFVAKGASFGFLEE